MVAATSKSSIVESVTHKEDGRGLIVSEPRYNDRVLEGMWRDRRIEKTKPSLPPFRGSSIYTTSFREPHLDAYEDDGAAWANRGKHEGVERAVLLESSGPECRHNFTSTNDLFYRILPQVCAQRREFNTRHLEWLPAQDLLPCMGNRTLFGLKEHLESKWARERTATRMDSVTTHKEHYHKPCEKHRQTSRSAIPRIFSSSLQSNNVILANQRLRGKQVLIAPSVQMGEYPIDVKRKLLPIVPELALEPSRHEADPSAVKMAGPHPFPQCCVRVNRCRRVPCATPVTVPSPPLYYTPCTALPPVPPS